MNTQPIQQTLTELRFTASLSEEDQRKLAEIAHWANFQANTKIFCEGRSPDELFFDL